MRNENWPRKLTVAISDRDLLALKFAILYAKKAVGIPEQEGERYFFQKIIEAEDLILIWAASAR